MMQNGCKFKTMDKKKKLKIEYKNAKPQVGIFRIFSKENSKSFICSASDIQSRINRYKTQLKLGTHFCKSLQKDWELYGEQNFLFEVLSDIEPLEDNESISENELEEFKFLIIEQNSIKNIYE